MLLDTSGLLNILSPREPQHAQAAELFRTNRKNVTHNLVLAELVALGHARRIPRHDVLQTVDDLLADPLTAIIWIDFSLTMRALALLRARLDKAYSLTDAVSFLIMRDHGIHEALTTDHHFEQEGFQRLLT